MKTFKATLLVLFSMTLLSACGKKDGDFAAKYAKNRMGATATNPDAVAQAYNAAQMDMDFIDIRTASESPMTFSVKLVVDNMYREVTTTMSATAGAIVQGTVKVGNYDVEIQSACGNVGGNCNPYFIMASAKQNGQTRLQIGYKFYRLQATAEYDRYHAAAAGSIMSFEQMVQYLNSVQ